MSDVELREDRAIASDDNMLTEYDVPVGTYTIENYNFFIDLFRKYYVKILNSYEGMRGKKLEFYNSGKHTFDENKYSIDFLIISDIEELFFHHTPLINLHTKIKKYFNGIYGKNVDIANDEFQEQFVKEGGQTLLKDFQKNVKNLKIENVKKPKCYDIYNKTIKTLYPNISETEMMWFDFLFISCFVPNPPIQLGFNLNKEKIFGKKYEDVYVCMHRIITLIIRERWVPRTSFFSKYRRNGKFNFLWYDFTSPNSKNDFNLEINPERCDRLLKAKSVNDWLFKPISDGKLSIKDFSYISDIPYISDIIKNGWNGEKGINILLYGVPGTGKTELCKALAKDLGAILYSTGSRTNIFDSKRSTGCDKVRDIELINESIPVDKKPLILVDEAEDIFYRDDINDGISKANLNETLENTKYPVLWTTNNAYIDPAFRRRFTYAICFDNIPRAKRKEIIEEICKKEDFIITNRVMNNMLDNNVDFGTASTVIHTAKLNKGSEDEILKHLEQQVRLYLTTYHEAKNSNGNTFDPKLTNTDIDLINLCEKIKQTGRYNFTICSYGAPGTGKSAYAEYLAEQLNMPIIKKKTSDLLSMWVGGTEKNIAKAFKEAKDSKAVLIFDEADSLLQDRRNAHASWEVTQVNEMLVQMENHPYPFICTTNLYDKLDQASLRRFTFKIGYKYMTDNQIKLALKHFFNIDTNVENFHLSTCTAGDFMNIKNQVDFLGVKDYNTIIEMLRKEQENKNDDKPKTKIGFN